MEREDGIFFDSKRGIETWCSRGIRMSLGHVTMEVGFNEQV